MIFDIFSIIPGKKTPTQSGWNSFNSVCCHHRGHKKDTRHRGGIIFDENSNWIYHCFNCNFKCGFTLGKPLTRTTRNLLEWCGLDQVEIASMNLESLKSRGIADFTQKKRTTNNLTFRTMELPAGAELISKDNANHKKFVDYLSTRGFDPEDYPFMVTPDDTGRKTNRIIIPYTFNNKIVGHIDRYLDERVPKYIKTQQPGYVFGIDLQSKDWEVCIVCEGVLDALSINGCAIMHDAISGDQAHLLKSLNRTIIIVPDLDKTGLTICDQALELGFQVSIPTWETGVKDVNDAVLKYGKFPTLLSILQNATSNRIKVELKRRKYVKRI